MAEYALITKLEFFESHFKVHYTKGYRLSYPIPLPTSVAGIFASMLGINRRDIVMRFRNYRFGAALANKHVESVEQVTFLQFGVNRRGVARTHVLVDPSFYLVAACREKEEVENMRTKIKNGLEYLPFGGQNDFFCKDWSIVGVNNVLSSTEIGNYLPCNLVGELTEGVIMEILPVMHKLGESPEFYFILNGRLISKQKLPVCSVNGKNIALYKLDNFYTVGEWSS